MRCDHLVHSVELVVDDATDTRIRAQWETLRSAGLPSQARHTGVSNRPHITLALAATIGADVAARLAVVAAELPIPITLGGLLLFGSHRIVLARLAVPATDLLRFQGDVLAALDDDVDPHGTFAAGRWTAHVTLARRLTADQVAEAVTALGDLPPISGSVVRARTWDMTAKQEHWLGP